MFLGIEIGGTKLQLGLGQGDGVLASLWRGAVNPALGGEGIREQIVSAIPELFSRANIERGELRGVGIGFGGPTDDATQSVIKSHQIAGWDGFPLAQWVSKLVGVPAVLCNDADVAGLGEALFGAGRGLSPIFYMTIGSGIGGGLIIDGQIYRGVGRGAAEIGHLKVPDYRHYFSRSEALENIASGWAIQEHFRLTHLLREYDDHPESLLPKLPKDEITPQRVCELAASGDVLTRLNLDLVWSALAHALVQVITLLCPRRIVIGGGVSLMGDRLFEPLRCKVTEKTFPPFADLTDIVPAALGEEMVVHGALALARQKVGE